MPPQGLPGESAHALPSTLPTLTLNRASAWSRFSPSWIRHGSAGAREAAAESAGAAPFMPGTDSRGRSVDDPFAVGSGTGAVADGTEASNDAGTGADTEPEVGSAPTGPPGLLAPPPLCASAPSGRRPADVGSGAPGGDGSTLTPQVRAAAAGLRAPLMSADSEPCTAGPSGLCAARFGLPGGGAPLAEKVTPSVFRKVSAASDRALCAGVPGMELEEETSRIWVPLPGRPATGGSAPTALCASLSWLVMNVWRTAGRRGRMQS